CTGRWDGDYFDYW
nr:immunoglobulin heavy chain junction region [Mus musculus]